MTKFIGVSLTLLLVASMTSAVMIESPAAHMLDANRSIARLTKAGFTNVAIVSRDGASI